MHTLHRFGKDALAEHPALLTALGLSPLAVKSTTLASGVVLGLAFAALLALSTLVVLAVRRCIPGRYKFAFLLLITSTWAGVIDMGLQAFLFQMRTALDVYLPLIAVNALILAILDKHGWDGTAGAAGMQAGLAGVMVLLMISATGLIREVLSAGTLSTHVHIFSRGMPIFASSAGAFIVLGCVLALFNHALASRSGGYSGGG